MGIARGVIFITAPKMSYIYVQRTVWLLQIKDEMDH